MEDRLCKVGFHLASICSICVVSNELADYLFLRCPLTVALWEAAFSAFQGCISADSWGFFFSQAMAVSFSDQSLVWRAVSRANRLGIGCMRNCMDYLLILWCFGLRGRPTKTLVIRSVIWSPSTSGWIKVNTDGAALSSLGTEGYRGIFRNCRSFVKGCFDILLGHVFAFEVELLAASMGINFAWKYMWSRIWQKSDYSYVVQLLSSRSKHVPWRLRQAWQRCIFQISQMEFQMSHIFREYNRVADALSKDALGLEVDSWWFSTPSFCSSLVGNDYMGR
ncbi:hypothetical protein Dsin_028975 [Dipteronia sinensis]|uniref:RNase H type-1 domain-containing protein n=1 Tax=Dipteronia sinensis TaxID=43782 RepID=A0AAE0DV35_9ROSI|nr:hypothetical protein Dsin_028975 [Dipteronia sinensis]